MKRYNVNIHGPKNYKDQKTFFIGTGFFGEPFDTVEDLKSLLYKYATEKENGKLYWREEIELSFALEETVNAIKQEGDRQCVEKGFVNMFKLGSIMNKDPFKGIKIVYRPGGWIDEEGKVFKFVLINGDNVSPRYCKLTNILREIGMEL